MHCATPWPALSPSVHHAPPSARALLSRGHVSIAHLGKLAILLELLDVRLELEVDGCKRRGRDALSNLHDPLDGGHTQAQSTHKAQKGNLSRFHK